MENSENEKGDIVVYKTADGKIRLETRFYSESLWLNISQMSELFQVHKSGISRHLKNIFETGELDRDSVVAIFATTAGDGKSYQVEHYNLDAVISVGYRVHSVIATRFRIWATQRLSEYIIKGFAIDDERLKNPRVSGMPETDYFGELLERIRDIRASEKRVYLRVREIFSMAADYEPNDKDTIRFFSIIQNKLHFAATGKTAAEIISERADSSKPNMGLTTWKGDEPRKTDAIIAKNYLNESEIDELNRIVVMWLDFAEDQAKRRKKVFMKDWESRLDDFLRFNERRVLSYAGRVTKVAADRLAIQQFEDYSEMLRRLKEEKGSVDYLIELENAARGQLEE